MAGSHLGPLGPPGNRDKISLGLEGTTVFMGRGRGERKTTTDSTPRHLYREGRQVPSYPAKIPSVLGAEETESGVSPSTTGLDSPEESPGGFPRLIKGR